MERKTLSVRTAERETYPGHAMNSNQSYLQAAMTLNPTKHPSYCEK